MIRIDGTAGEQREFHLHFKGKIFRLILYVIGKSIWDLDEEGKGGGEEILGEILIIIACIIMIINTIIWKDVVVCTTDWWQMVWLL